MGTVVDLQSARFRRSQRTNSPVQGKEQPARVNPAARLCRLLNGKVLAVAFILAVLPWPLLLDALGK